MTGPVLVIATKNMNKVAEFRAGLAGLGFNILSLTDFPPNCPPEIEEDGATFAANALKKSSHRILLNRLSQLSRRFRLGSGSLTWGPPWCSLP